MNRQTIDELKGQLRAPVRSLRLCALDRLLRECDDAIGLQTLVDHAAVETDAQCTLVLRHAVAVVRERIVARARSDRADLDNLPALPQAGDPSFADFGGCGALAAAESRTAGVVMPRLEQLLRLAPEALAPLLPVARKILRREIDPVVVACVVRRFASLWTADDLAQLSRCLDEEPPQLVAFAVLEVLARRDPGRLLPHLPLGLASDDPVVRGLSVQALISIDSAEALQHLSATLASADPAHRAMAITNAVFFPFAEVRPLLLGFVAAEQDPELLTRAGLLLEINADPEVPYRLCDMIDGATPAKAQFLRQQLQRALRAIRLTMPADQGAAYQKRLQDWVNQRLAETFVRRLVARLSLPGVEPDQALLEGVRCQCERPEVLAVLRQARSWTLPGDVRRRIDTLITEVEATMRVRRPVEVASALSELPGDRRSAPDVAALSPVGPPAVPGPAGLRPEACPIPAAVVSAPAGPPECKLAGSAVAQPVAGLSAEAPPPPGGIPPAAHVPRRDAAQARFLRPPGGEDALPGPTAPVASSLPEAPVSGPVPRSEAPVSRSLSTSKPVGATPAASPAAYQVGAASPASPAAPQAAAVSAQPPSGHPIPTSAPPAFDPARLFEVPEDEQIRAVALLHPADLPRWLPLMRQIVDGGVGTDALRATTLRTALRLEYGEFIRGAEKVLSGRDENLVAAAIEYLDRFDPERLGPFLGLFLKADSLRLRSLALATLRRFDPKQAVSAVSALLNSKTPEERHLALACMVSLDFSLVRELVVGFLAGAPPDALFDAALMLFRANPDSENLYPLFALENRLGGQRGERVQSVRLETQQALTALGLLEPAGDAARLAAWRAKFAEEQQRAKRPAAPYSVRAVGTGRRSIEDGPSAPLFGERWRRWRGPLGYAAAAAVMLLAFWLTAAPDLADARARFRGGAVRATASEQTGMLTRVDIGAGTAVFLPDGGNPCLLMVDRPVLGRHRPGDRVVVDAVPFRVYPDGVTLMRVRSIRVL